MSGNIKIMDNKKGGDLTDKKNSDKSKNKKDLNHRWIK